MSAWDLLFWYAIRVERAYDGDSLTDCTLDLGFRHCWNKVSLRFAGVDTPEINGKTEIERRMAVAAREFVIDALPEDGTALIDSCRDENDVYGRALGYVYSDKEGALSALGRPPHRSLSINHALIDTALGCPYGGDSARPAKGKPSFWPKWYRQHQAQIDPMIERYAPDLTPQYEKRSVS